MHELVERLKPPWPDKLEITDAIQGLVDARGAWPLSTGRKDDLLRAKRVMLDEWVVRRFEGSFEAESRIERWVRLETGAVVERRVVRGPAVIRRGATVRDSFIGAYRRVGDGSRVERFRIKHSVVLSGAVVEAVEWLGNSLVGPNAVGRRDATNHRALRR